MITNVLPRFYESQHMVCVRVQETETETQAVHMQYASF